jgi:hypothetical protein
MSSVELEYNAVRGEQLQRLGARQQNLSLTLTLVGGFLGAGWAAGSSIVMMIYPLVALLLGAYWAQNEIYLARLSAYLRDYLEPNLPGAGYERWGRGQENALTFMGMPVEIAAIAGILLLGQVFGVVLGLLYAFFVDRRFTDVHLIILIADVAAMFALFTLVGTVTARASR